MADTIFNGKEYNLYLAAGGAPASPDATTNYSLLLLGQNLTFSDVSERLKSNNKSNGARVTTLTGDQEANISGTAEFAKDTNTGQTIVLDAVKTTTSANKTVGFLLTSNQSGEIEFHGTANAISFEITFDNNAIALLSYELAVDGDYTMVTAA